MVLIDFMNLLDFEINNIQQLIVLTLENNYCNENSIKKGLCCNLEYILKLYLLTL